MKRYILGICNDGGEPTYKFDDIRKSAEDFHKELVEDGYSLDDKDDTCLYYKYGKGDRHVIIIQKLNL